MTKDTAVILAAAGKSSRFGQPFVKKVFATLSGKPVWQHSATLFSEHPSISQVIMVIHPDDREMVRSKFAATIAMMGIELVLGGEERWQSIENGLSKVLPNTEYIAVHDAARPLLSRHDLDHVLDGARQYGAAILAEAIHGTVKRTDPSGMIEATISRERLFQAQTPQVFRRGLLVEAFTKRGDAHPTDDAQLVEKTGHRVYVVPGNRLNIKITTSEDLRWAEIALKTQSSLR